MFYKYENEELIAGPMVTFPDGSFLYIDPDPEVLVDTSMLPKEGWYYFKTEQEAKEFFGIVDENI